jgi:hypothetical protein
MSDTSQNACRRTEPTRSLLQGGVYVPADHSDIRRQRYAWPFRSKDERRGIPVTNQERPT